MSDQKLIVLVGGGPVGLYTALLFAEKYHNLHIAVFEKRQMYSRSHTVYIDPLHPLIIPCSREPVIMLSEWLAIQQIEEQLRHQLECVHNAGDPLSNFVSFHLYEFTTMASLLTHPFFNTRGIPELVVFASGAKSSVRELYFGGDLYRTPYNNVCISKYQRQIQATSDASETRLQWNHHYRVCKLINCYVQESVHNNVVTLIVIGDFDNTIIKEKSSIVINSRRVELGEKVIGVVSYSYFPLEISRSASVVSVHEGVPIYLVGDAAAGIPFQKGLTTGIQCADALVQFGGSCYADHFDQIIDEKVNTSTFRAQLLRLFLYWNSFWQGDLLEWQRWSRDYEQLLCNPQISIYDPSLSTHPSTLNRKLILEEFKEFILRFLLDHP